MTLALFQALDQLGDRLPDALRVSRWPGGLCNRLYRISSQDGDFALRVNHPDADRLGVNRKREQQIMIALADQSWCPTTLSINERWLLTPWQPGELPASGERANLVWLATALSAVQSVEVPGPALNIADQIQHLSQWAKALPTAFTQAVQSHCDHYDLPSQLALCHHDWHPGNLKITATDWVLLDWEFAALGDPAMDLAALCTGFALSDHQSEQLAEVMEISAARLRRAQAMMSALAVAWYAANPSLAPATAPSADDWLARWG